MIKKDKILLLLLLLLLTSCPKEPMWYSIFVRNTNKVSNLKIFINQNNPGDSSLPINQENFIIGLEKFNTEYPASFRICMHQIRGIRECIESQPKKKIFVFIFDSDTLDKYDYAVIRDEEMYKDRIEIPYTMATNDSNLIIEYP